MNTGELLTRITIWASIVAYISSVVIFVSSRGRTWNVAARVAYTGACLSLLVHVCLAFQFYHGWSQVAAYRDTARQTNEVVGINWGGGLYINYLVLVLWSLDVLCWWLGGLESYRRRSGLLTVAWHSFLIFIIFNATIVFGHGAARWAGLMVCVCWGSAVWAIARDSSTRG
jgi:hypothetical protein